MSKKHFIAVANDLRTNLDMCQTDAERHIVERVARDIAHTFASFNGNFDRARFLKACGV